MNENIKTLLSLNQGDTFKFNNFEFVVMEKFNGGYKFIELAYLNEIRYIFKCGPSILLKENIDELVQLYDIVIIGDNIYITKRGKPKNPDIAYGESSIDDLKLLNVRDMVDGEKEIYDIDKYVYSFEQKIIIRKAD